MRPRLTIRALTVIVLAVVMSPALAAAQENGCCRLLKKGECHNVTEAQCKAEDSLVGGTRWVPKTRCDGRTATCVLTDNVTVELIVDQTGIKLRIQNIQNAPVLVGEVAVSVNGPAPLSCVPGNIAVNVPIAGNGVVEIIVFSGPLPAGIAKGRYVATLDAFAPAPAQQPGQPPPPKVKQGSGQSKFSVR